MKSAERPLAYREAAQDRRFGEGVSLGSFDSFLGWRRRILNERLSFSNTSGCLDEERSKSNEYDVAVIVYLIGRFILWNANI